jgi:hypothetical protein
MGGKCGKDICGAEDDTEKAETKSARDVDYVKKDHMQCGCNFMQENKRQGGRKLVGQLQRDLLGSYYWSGNCCLDYGYFICNWHPLLGIFLSHPAHPWSKVERLATFIFSCCLSMVPSALVINALQDTAAERGEFFLVFVSVTLPVLIWEIALYWIAVGDAFCKGRGCICDCFAEMFRMFKNCCLFFSVIFSLGVFGLSFWIMSAIGAPWYMLLRPLVISRVQSWVTWFPIWTFLPCLGFLWAWCEEKKAAEAAESDSDAVHNSRELMDGESEDEEEASEEEDE